ncbi:hypothetical protein NL676_000079 [Syzygium grande]|nr:hypothetical protein NL676_000079 [Syzygium grande]
MNSVSAQLPGSFDKVQKHKYEFSTFIKDFDRITPIWRAYRSMEIAMIFFNKAHEFLECGLQPWRPTLKALPALSFVVMEYLKDRASQLVIACLLLVGLLYIFFNSTPTGADLLFQLQGKNTHPSIVSGSNATEYRDELEEALAKVTRPNKMVIIAMVNEAYVEGDKPMLDLFLDGFWLGEDTRALVNNLLLVAIDQMAFERCMFLRLHCYKLQTENDLAREKVYMSQDFINMMWRRTLFLGDVLERGYSFIFTDTDVMWLRDPFPRLSPDDTVDLQISNDRFNGDEWSQANPINTGFYMVRSNNKTVALFREWYQRKNGSLGLKEQDVLDRMMQEGAFAQLGLRVRFLETALFSGFCEDSRDVRVVSTVHANCCRTIKAKVADLTSIAHDWKRFKGSPPANDTVPFAWSRHSACEESWH